MNVIYFSSAINENAVRKLIDDINKCEDECTVYFDSWGGDSAAALAFIDFTNKANIKITMVANGNLQSAGFMMFYFSNTKKETLVGKNTMCHRCSYTKKEWVRSFFVGVIGQHKETSRSLDVYVLSNLITLGVNQKKLNDFTNKKDVYFFNKEADLLAVTAQKLYYTKG